MNEGFFEKRTVLDKQEKPENTNSVLPKEALDMYVVEGYGDISYKNYVKSSRDFELQTTDFDQDKKEQSSLVTTKSIILEQGEDKISPFIAQALQSSDIEIQRIGASLIERAPEDQKVNLWGIAYEKIIEALNNPDVQIQRIAMNMVGFVPEGMRGQLREIILEKIVDAFSRDDVDVWRVMAKKIDLAPGREQDRLREIVCEKVINALGDDDLRVQRLGAVMVRYAPISKQVELRDLVREKFELAKAKGRFKEIVESLLYLKASDRNTNFSREVFSKTGSETTLLLGKQFRDNLIFRHVEKAPFLAWRSAYENYAEWSKAGFDYVPIEPIYLFHYDNNHKLVNVVSGVLDLNLEEWYAFSDGAFKSDLERQKSKILDVLTGLNIDHGHPNDSNFCLRFSRDKEGNIELDKAPRIYLIDFDKAVKA